MSLTQPIDPSAGQACTGVQPLSARWEPWMDDLMRDPSRCAELLSRHGSPVHLHELSAFHRNVDELRAAARRSGVDFQVFFARKANKCLSYVEAARRAGIGVDVASEQELRQVLDAGVPADKLIVTAAVKSVGLLELALAGGVCIAIDNDDEAVALASLCRQQDTPARVALRVHGFSDGRRQLDSRFGIRVDEVRSSLRRWMEHRAMFRIEGLHFHLDGYSASDRVLALDTALSLADELREDGVELEFIDMGGGFPMSYLDDAAEWSAYWTRLESAVVGRQEPITYKNHGFGLLAHAGEVVGRRAAYPHAQSPVGASWLMSILDAPRPSAAGQTIARALVDRRIRLHCEPGRALLDGCGMTLARVEHRKKVAGDWLIGLHMNSSNCRSQKSELFADPRLVPVGERPNHDMAGYLTGAYCAEGDLITHRRLIFAGGVAVGDIVAFPNTAGYLMHFVESRSHQFDLPQNLVIDSAGSVEVDEIDRGSD